MHQKLRFIIVMLAASAASCESNSVLPVSAPTSPDGSGATTSTKPATVADASPKVDPTAQPDPGSIEALDQLFTVRFDTHTGEYHGDVLAKKLSRLMTSADSSVAHGARAMQAELLAEWLTLTWVVESLEAKSGGRRQRRERWRGALMRAATNGGRGQADFASLLAGAGQRQLFDIPIPSRPELDRLGLHRRTDKDRPLSNADYTVVQAVGSLAADIPVDSPHFDRARSAAVWVAVAAAAKPTRARVGVKEPKRRPRNPTFQEPGSRPEVQVSEHLATLSVGGKTFAAIANLYLRAAYRQLNMFALGGKAVRTTLAALGHSLPAPNPIKPPRGGWPQMDASLATVAQAAELAKLPLDDTLAIPQRFEGWRDGLALWMAEQAAPSPEHKAALARLDAGLCRATGGKPKCFLVKAADDDDDAYRKLRMTTTFAHVHREKLLPGYLHELGVLQSALDGTDEGLTRLENRAKKRWATLGIGSSETPLLLAAFALHVAARLKTQGVDTNRVKASRRGHIETRVSGRPRVLVRRVDDCITDFMKGERDGCLLASAEKAVAVAKRGATGDVSSDAVGRLGKLEGTLSRKTIRAALSDETDFARSARIIPHYGGGEARGV